MAGLFGNAGPTSAGGMLGANYAQQQPGAIPVDQNGMPMVYRQFAPGGNNLAAGFANMQGQAIVPGIINGLMGFATGVRTDPQGVQMQIQGAAIQSLMSKYGMSYPQALAAYSNPEVQKWLWGAPVSNGIAEMPNGAKVPVISRPGAIGQYAMPQDQAMRDAITNTPTVRGEVKAGDVSAPLLSQGGNVSLGLPPLNAAAPNASPMQQLMDLGAKAAQQKAAATKLGDAQGTNAGTLPNTLAVLDQAKNNIDLLLKDPNLSSVIGPVAGRLPAMTGGMADTINRIGQLQSQTMLQGFQQLRGAGRITQAEMFKAGDALGRLNRVSSPEGFKQALQDLHEVVVAARTRAGQLAGQGETPPPQQAQAQTQGFSQDQLRAEAIRRGLIKP